MLIPINMYINTINSLNYLFDRSMATQTRHNRYSMFPLVYASIQADIPLLQNIPANQA